MRDQYSCTRNKVVLPTPIIVDTTTYPYRIHFAGIAFYIDSVKFCWYELRAKPSVSAAEPRQRPSFVFWQAVYEYKLS